MKTLCLLVLLVISIALAFPADDQDGKPGAQNPISEITNQAKKLGTGLLNNVQNRTQNLQHPHGNGSGIMRDSVQAFGDFIGLLLGTGKKLCEDITEIGGC